jgi:hypothetical protein
LHQYQTVCSYSNSQRPSKRRSRSS